MNHHSFLVSTLHMWDYVSMEVTSSYLYPVLPSAVYGVCTITIVTRQSSLHRVALMLQSVLHQYYYNISLVLLKSWPWTTNSSVLLVIYTFTYNLQILNFKKTLINIQLILIIQRKVITTFCSHQSAEWSVHNCWKLMSHHQSLCGVKLHLQNVSQLAYYISHDHHWLMLHHQQKQSKFTSVDHM